MSVVVTQDMSLDLALRLSWREANRENIVNKIKENRYYISPSEKRHVRKKVFAKRRKRFLKRKRRMQN